MAVSAVKKERAKPADDADEGAPAAKPSGRGGKSKLLLVAGVVLLAGGGGGTYWYLQHSSGTGKHEAKVEPAKPPVFVPLEAFTVNLQIEESPQFLQVGLSFKVRDNAVVDALKLHMPEVRRQEEARLRYCRHGELHPRARHHKTGERCPAAG